jgi:hypothetical protein
MQHPYSATLCWALVVVAGCSGSYEGDWLMQFEGVGTEACHGVGNVTVDDAGNFTALIAFDRCADTFGAPSMAICEGTITEDGIVSAETVRSVDDCDIRAGTLNGACGSTSQCRGTLICDGDEGSCQGLREATWIMEPE